MEHLWGPWSWPRGEGRAVRRIGNWNSLLYSSILHACLLLNTEPQLSFHKAAVLLLPRVLVTNAPCWGDQSQPCNNHSYWLRSSEGQVSLVLVESFVERPCWTVIPAAQLTNPLHSGFLPLDSLYHFQGVLVHTLSNSTTPVIMTRWWFSEFLEWQLHGLPLPHLSTSPVPPPLWVFLQQKSHNPQHDNAKVHFIFLKAI